MAHIAVITSGLTGMLHASFEIVERLKNEGHQITYLCPHDVRAKVEIKAINYVQLPSLNFAYWPTNNRLIHSFLNRISHHFKNLKSKNELGKQALKIKEIQKVLASVAPDKVVVDVELHEVIYSALKLNIPFTLLSAWFPNLKLESIPPIQTTIVPGVGFEGSKTGISLRWIFLNFKSRTRELISKLLLRNYRRVVLKKYAKELNVSSSSLKYSSFPPLFHYKQWPTIHMVLREMDFPQANFPNIFYAGPMILDKRDANKEVPDLELLNTIQTKENRKIIYCSVSTLNKGDLNFIKKVVSAVKEEGNWILIVSLGGKISKNDFENVPDNVILKEWVPQLQLLEIADCSINHAGIHTINECIHFKVPMLIYSGKHHDQNGCAARVAYHDMGIVGDKDVDSSTVIRTKIHSLLTQPRYQNKMSAINDTYQVAKRQNLTSYLQ